MAMQPFMARLAAIERSSLATNTKAVKEPIPQHVIDLTNEDSSSDDEEL